MLMYKKMSSSCFGFRIFTRALRESEMGPRFGPRVLMWSCEGECHPYDPSKLFQVNAYLATHRSVKPTIPSLRYKGMGRNDSDKG
jgi:hypothetical protein